MEKWEKWFHIVPITIAMVTSIIGAYLKLYNFAKNRCWLADYPTGCADNPNVECEAGENIHLMRWLLMFAFLSTTMALMVICMVVIFLFVRNIENRNLNHNFSYQNRENLTISPEERSRWHEKSRKAAKHAYLYCSSYFITFIWYYIFRGLQQEGILPPFALLLVGNFFIGAQGIWTYGVFKLRRKSSVRRSTKLASSKHSNRNSNQVSPGVVLDATANGSTDNNNTNTCHDNSADTDVEDCRD